MNRALLTKVLGTLLAAAALFLIAKNLIKPDPQPEQVDSPEGTIQPPRDDGSTLTKTPPALDISPDRPTPDDPFDSEGEEQLKDFITAYARSTDPEDKVNFLVRARKLDIEDHPDINQLLVNEAFSSDEDIREAARIGMREYGDEDLHRQLEAILISQPDAPDRRELDKILDFIALPSFNPAER